MGLHAEITAYEVEELEDEEDRSIPADPTVRNFSFYLVDGKLYFRENSRMHPVELSVTAENRIRGMMCIRDCPAAHRASDRGLPRGHDQAGAGES
jgi:hypothetical protein